MSEIERYNGLTTADKGALLDAKLAERNYVVLRDGKIDHFTIEFPRFKHHNKFNWEIVAIDLALAQIAEMESAEKPIHSERYYEILEEIKGWKPWQKEAFNQLATSEHATQIDITEKPLTWNERINQMTVEEKADVALNLNLCAGELRKPYDLCDEKYLYASGMQHNGRFHDCRQCWIDFLNSPYTEGATK